MTSAQAQPLTLPVGAHVHVMQPNGDEYQGFVVRHHGDSLCLGNYTAWHEGDAVPYTSPYADDEVLMTLVDVGGNRARVIVDSQPLADDPCECYRAGRYGPSRARMAVEDYPHPDQYREGCRDAFEHEHDI